MLHMDQPVVEGCMLHMDLTEQYLVDINRIQHQHQELQWAR